MKQAQIDALLSIVLHVPRYSRLTYCEERWTEKADAVLQVFIPFPDGSLGRELPALAPLGHLLAMHACATAYVCTEKHWPKPLSPMLLPCCYSLVMLLQFVRTSIFVFTSNRIRELGVDRIVDRARGRGKPLHHVEERRRRCYEGAREQNSGVLVLLVGMHEYFPALACPAG